MAKTDFSPNDQANSGWQNVRSPDLYASDPTGAADRLGKALRTVHRSLEELSGLEETPYDSLDEMLVDSLGKDGATLVSELDSIVDQVRGLIVQASRDSVVKPEDRTLRERVEAFALSEAAEPGKRHLLTELYKHWHQWNQTHFGGLLVTPLLLLAEPSEPKTLGQYSYVSAIGGAGQIRIRPSLLRGTHPMWTKPPTEKQSMRFGLDVLLHEMIHQWQHEVLRNSERSYSGHGPAFRDKCNEIGATLKLGPVRTCKKRGKDKDLPSCSHWPHCVRPSGYAGSIRWEGE